MKLYENDKKFINSILESVREYRVSHKWNNNEVVLISFDFLFNKILIDNEKIKFCKKILSINPLKYGFNGVLYNENKNEIEPRLFKILSGQKLKNNTKIQAQYVLKDVYAKFKRMNNFLKKDIGVGVIIQSGYRSPAYQLIVFLWNLRNSNYNFNKIAREVALPFYSEHGCAYNQALDFVAYNSNDLFDSTNFKKTKEYKWLKENAEYFGFYESYPKNNKLGFIYEPWHWHFENKKTE